MTDSTDAGDRTTSITVALIAAKWHGTEPPPKATREFGIAATAAAVRGLESQHPDGVQVARVALRALADAFLGDRAQNADLFELAHKLGSRVSAAGGCQLTPGDPDYTLECPVLSLHQNVAHSLELTVITECSICAAATFGCLHVPGREYGGEVCLSRVGSIGPIGAVVLTPNPDFVYTWHRVEKFPVSQLLDDGAIESAGDRAQCVHCRHVICKPSADELDPVGRWERLVAENMPSTG